MRQARRRASEVCTCSTCHANDAAELDRDRLERQQHPKQRGRKKGCKRGTLKDISGNLVSLVDLQKGDEMLQVGRECGGSVGSGGGGQE